MRFFVLAWTLVMLWAACSYSEPSYDGVVFGCDGAHACPTGAACVAGRCAGVTCGDQICGPGKVCCNDAVNALRCTSPGACGGQQLECDGAEDCSGESCCLGTSGADEGDTVCQATCSSLTVCTNNSQCPGALPNCCAVPGAQLPFKGCRLTPC